MPSTAEQLHRRAVDLSIQGRYALALRAADDGLRAADDPDLRARLLGTKAVVLQRTGRPDAAEQVCTEALGLDGTSGHTRAILEGQLGAIAMYGGRFDDADRRLSHAIRDLDADPVAAARVRINRSLVSVQRRLLEPAADDLRVAVDVLGEHGLATDAAQARHNLGYLALLAGDLVSALEQMLIARQGAAVSTVAAAIGDVDRAEVLRDAGLTTEAERILAATARVFGAQRMPQSRADAELSLARSQLTHDPAAAARTAGAAARRFRRLGNTTGAARADGVRVRAALAHGVVDQRGDAVPAVRIAPDAAEVEAVAAALDAAGLAGEAATLRLAGQLRAAGEERRQAQRPRTAARLRAIGRPAAVRVPRGAPIDVRLLADEVRVARALAAGREADVRRHAAAGLDELSLWQGSFGSLDLQASGAMHAVPLLSAGLSSALRSRRPELVFDWSERARQSGLQVVPLRPPPDPAAAAELAELRMLRADASGADWLADPRAAQLHDRLRERQWTSTGALGVRPRIALAEAQSALDAGTALLSFVWSDGVIACLVTTRASAVIVDLDDWREIRVGLAGLRADLDVSAAVRSGPMAAVVSRALRARIDSLSAQLLERPLAVAGEPRRVVITTPGVLAGIPWAMLPALRGRPFTLAVSASRWVGLRERDADTPLKAGIAVGPRIARGGEEARAAAAAWAATPHPAAVLSGAAASAGAVTELAGAVSVLHVAAHGRHAGDNPMFSGLELSDGTLFGYDIDLMTHLPATVVLSACEVGRSSVRWGEEALGMTRTWLHAGSRCVIAAPVVVADDEACELLGAVHSGLAAGHEPADALAAASVATGVVAPFQCHGAGF